MSKQNFATTLVRRVHFSSGHRYFQPKWDENKNREVFGRCYSEHGHGHNYILEAAVTGPVDADSGMIMNLRDLDQLLKSVSDELDHAFLNSDVPHFQTVVPTTENVACYLAEKIRSQLPSEIQLSYIRLFEGEDLWAEVRP